MPAPAPVGLNLIRTARAPDSTEVGRRRQGPAEQRVPESAEVGRARPTPAPESAVACWTQPRYVSAPAGAGGHRPKRVPRTAEVSQQSRVPDSAGTGRTRPTHAPESAEIGRTRLAHAPESTEIRRRQPNTAEACADTGRRLPKPEDLSRARPTPAPESPGACLCGKLDSRVGPPLAMHLAICDLAAHRLPGPVSDHLPRW